MNIDSHSLNQYIKDILNKYGPDAKPPNKHHPILTDNLILCLKEIINRDKGGSFVFQNDNIVLKISGLGDHVTPNYYYTYIICRILLEIKDYSIIYKNIDKSDVTYVLKPFVHELHGIYLREQRGIYWEDV
jgi:hypothetical protein